MRPAALAFGIGCALSAAGLATDAPAAGPPARLLVSGGEWSLTLSRSHVVAGRAAIQFLNRGEDEHDLRLRRISGARSDANPLARWRLTRPGGVSELSLRLKPGRYRLWCSLPKHRALGMRAVLSVSSSR
jgi:hypothetical protein